MVGAPPDGFIGPIEGGPSREVPPTTVLCLSGVSKAWLFSALFRKALFQFQFSECLPFRNGPSTLQHCCSFCRGFTSLHWVVCETVPRPLDNPGYWNGRSNVTSFAPWSASVALDVSKFNKRDNEQGTQRTPWTTVIFTVPQGPQARVQFPCVRRYNEYSTTITMCPLSHPVRCSTKDSEMGWNP